MLRAKGKVFSLSLLAFFSLNAFATPQQTYTLVSPTCLAKQISEPYQTIVQQDNLILLTTNDSGLQQFIAAKQHQKSLCGGFINVTDAWKNFKKENKLAPVNAFLKRYASNQKNLGSESYEIKHQKEVNQMLSFLNPNGMWASLTTLSSFHDRYANSDNGVKAANWFKEKIEALAKQYNRNDVSVELISTGSSYKQPSLVVKVGNSNEPAVVIGGHMDTLQGFFGNMPGADDDGTGSVTVLEVAKTLFSSNMQFKRPIYFIWYSAEEEGLVGSQYVVSQFKKRNIPVAEVLHMDMTGYANQNDPTLWLIKDNTNPDLTKFLEKLISTYVKQPVKYTACGYACSDHATWTQNGYKSAIAFEAEFGKDDPDIHTSNDTMNALSLSHMTDYAKLATAFMVELAEPV